MFDFHISAQDGNARVGEFTTPHGTITTPVFMPVGTHGAVKGLAPNELKEIGTEIILGNTYHLYLRPGDGPIAELGGLHPLMRWDGPILTDSGGFQVFSLGERGISGRTKSSLRKVTDEGVTFQSHLDGSRHLLTPERSIQIQQNLGADIIMAFDQPVYGLTAADQVRDAMQRTKDWLLRSKAAWNNQKKQALFGIVQGGIHTNLHRESAQFTVSQDLPGYALGGLSVGEGKKEMWQATQSIVSFLPEDKPRYFMGLGHPLDLIEATSCGIDMYDCVAPTRLARHGAIWQLQGDPGAIEAFYTSNTEELLKNKLPLRFIRINLHRHTFRNNPEPVNPYLPGFERFSYATLNHYLNTGEMLGFRILSLHNLQILHLITGHLRSSIKKGRLQSLHRLFLELTEEGKLL